HSISRTSFLIRRRDSSRSTTINSQMTVRQRSMRMSLKNNTICSFLGALGTLALVGAGSYRSIQWAIRNEADVADSQQHLRGVVEIQTALNQAEAGMNGYVLTGELSNLRAFEAGRFDVLRMRDMTLWQRDSLYADIERAVALMDATVGARKRG